MKIRFNFFYMWIFNCKKILFQKQQKNQWDSKPKKNRVAGVHQHIVIVRAHTIQSI